MYNTNYSYIHTIEMGQTLVIGVKSNQSFNYLIELELCYFPYIKFIKLILIIILGVYLYNGDE